MRSTLLYLDQEMLPSRPHLAGRVIVAVLEIPAAAVAQPDDTMVHGSMPEHPMAQPPTPLGVPENRDASGTSWQLIFMRLRPPEMKHGAMGNM